MEFNDGINRNDRRKLGLGLALNNSFPKRNPEIDTKLREIHKKNGLIDINGVSYETTIGDLKDLGELGNGTSGHVVKMLHKDTGQIIAVKVRKLKRYQETIDHVIQTILKILANASYWQ